METQSRILVVDDSPEIGTTIKKIFDIHGYLVDIAVNGNDAISLCQKTQYDIVLVDIKLPDIPGPEVIEKMARISPSTDFIYITGYASVESAIEAVKREHVVSYETKPLDFDRLLSVIKQIIHRRQAEKALADERLLLIQRVAERTADLRTTNIELARAVRLKDEFLASISHELRTPLNAILGFTEALQDGIYGRLNERQAKSIQTIDESGQHLLSLISDILDLSKIGAGKMEVKRKLVSIGELCHTSLRFTQQIARNKNLKVTLTLESTANTLNADPGQMKHILVNLLSNAVKFNHNGGSVGLEVKIDEAEQVIHFIVWDTGIGIAQADIERIFQPFIQADGRLAREYEGAGLGLTLVQHLTELHGGSVSLETSLGKGSRFTVSLPWQKTAGNGQQEPEEVMSVSPEKISPTKVPVVLLVEDNEIHSKTVLAFLKNHYQVVVAKEGSEAIIRVQEVHPNIIIMDIQMPVMDGLEAIQRIRDLKEFKKTPIIAMTALAIPGERERCLALGANEYLNKPVRLKKLLEIIRQLVVPDNPY